MSSNNLNSLEELQNALQVKSKASNKKAQPKQYQRDTAQAPKKRDTETWEEYYKRMHRIKMSMNVTNTNSLGGGGGSSGPAVLCDLSIGTDTAEAWILTNTLENACFICKAPTLTCSTSIGTDTGTAWILTNTLENNCILCKA